MPDIAGRRERARHRFLEAVDELPLLTATRDGWAELAAERLPEFLADHAICEQQAALFGLNLVTHYPADAELVDRMTALAAEEVTHLRRVSQLLHRRGLQPSRRRSNPYVKGLHKHITRESEQCLKCDRLLVGALIEARSCERFGLLHERLEDRELAEFFGGLFESEARHHTTYVKLACTFEDESVVRKRLNELAAAEADIIARGDERVRVHS